MATDTAAPATQEQPSPSQQLQPAAKGEPPAQRGPAVAVKLGIAPTSVEEGWRLAQYLAQSELVPKNFRKAPADILVAIEMGMELGLPPMQALASIAVINGRASVWGDGFLALIMASSLYADHDEFYEVAGQRKDGLTADDLKKDDTAAVCTFWRHGKSTPVTRRFTIAQAKKANLLGKEGPWTNYPDRMLSMRARGFAGRDAFPDLLRGIRTAEEALDTPPAPPDIDVNPVREVRRLSETVTATTTTQPSASTAAPGTPMPPVAKGPESVEETLGPIGIKGVEQFLDGFTITLADGKQIDAVSLDDASELDKLCASGHQVRLVVQNIEGGRQLKSFAIAD
jgi:hypothetical protein